METWRMLICSKRERDEFLKQPDDNFMINLNNRIREGGGIDDFRQKEKKERYI